MTVTNPGLLVPSTPGFIGPFHFFCMQALLVVAGSGPRLRLRGAGARDVLRSRNHVGPGGDVPIRGGVHVPARAPARTRRRPRGDTRAGLRLGWRPRRPRPKGRTAADAHPGGRRRRLHRQPDRQAIARRGLPTVVLDNLSTGHGWAVRWGPLEVGDLADRDRLRAVFESYRVTAVIHFAAHAYVGESIVDPRRYFRNNVANTLNLLDAMLDAGVKTIVFSSSCTVYGDAPGGALSEDAPTAPVNPYGESKLMVERVLRWYERPTACAGWLCATSTPPGPIRKPRSARCTSPRPTYPADHRRRPGGARRCNLRNRLPDPRWDRHPRLHPRRRSGGCPPARGRAPAARRRLRGLQPRHRSGQLGAPGDGRGRALGGRPVPVQAPRRPGDPPGWWPTPGGRAACSAGGRVSRRWRPSSSTPGAGTPGPPR